jgi:hypothetical protein
VSQIGDTNMQSGSLIMLPKSQAPRESYCDGKLRRLRRDARTWGNATPELRAHRVGLAACALKPNWQELTTLGFPLRLPIMIQLDKKLDRTQNRTA